MRNTIIGSTVLFFVLSIALCGCQSNPTEALVQSKDVQAFLESIVIESKENQLENIPSQYENYLEFEEGKFNVTIDAQVDLLIQKSIPIAAVIPIDFIQEQADLILETLFNGTELYLSEEYREKTKEEILNELAYCNELLSENKDDEFQKSSLKALIKQLRIDLQNAPDSYDAPLASTKFEMPIAATLPASSILVDDEADDDSAAVAKEEFEQAEIEEKKELEKSKCIEGCSQLNKDRNSEIKIYNMANPFYNYMYFYNMNSTETVMSNDFLMKRYSQALVKNNIALPKYTDSLDLAKTTIDNLGAKNMELSNVYLTPKGSPQISVEDWPYCYEFIFSKSYNNATTTYVSNDYAYNKTYNEIWREEYIKIAIDNTGVILIDWRGPSQISEIINNNVKIKSFDEIMRIFESNIYINGAWDGDPEIVSRDIYIDNITLGMMKLRKPASKDEFISIPVWDFFGHNVNEYTDNTQYILDENNKLRLEKAGHSYLTINAIDGSIIDRSVGY